MNRYNKFLLILIGLYLLITSFYGLWVFFDNFFKIDFFESLKYIFLILPVYLYSFFVSILFFLRLTDYSKLNRILIYVYILQVIQMFHFRIYSLGFYILFGSNVDIGYCSFCDSKFYFNASYFENAVMIFTEDNSGYVVSINLFAVALICLIFVLQKRIRDSENITLQDR